MPGSLHAAILAVGEAAAWQAMTGLADTARTGEPAFTAQRGQNYCDYLAAQPASARHVSDVAASRSAGIAAVVARLDFTGSTVIAEIGGRGIIVAAVLAAHPQLRGIVFDRTRMLEAARDYLAAASLTGRTELAAGDYLDGPVPPASSYVLAGVLPQHDDGQARVILGNLRAAAKAMPGGPCSGVSLPGPPGVRGAARGRRTASPRW